MLALIPSVLPDHANRRKTSFDIHQCLCTLKAGAGFPPPTSQPDRVPLRKAVAEAVFQNEPAQIFADIPNAFQRLRHRIAQRIIDHTRDVVGKESQIVKAEEAVHPVERVAVCDTAEKPGSVLLAA